MHVRFLFLNFANALLYISYSSDNKWEFNIKQEEENRRKLSRLSAIHPVYIPF